LDAPEFDSVEEVGGGGGADGCVVPDPRFGYIKFCSTLSI
jgi:hypothetical protein